MGTTIIKTLSIEGMTTWWVRNIRTLLLFINIDSENDNNDNEF